MAIKSKKLKGRLIWRCRRCGGRESITAPEMEKKESIERSALGKLMLDWFPDTAMMVKLHECQDGGLGIADLQGAE